MGVVTFRSDSIFRKNGSQVKIARAQAQKTNACVDFVLDRMKDVSKYIYSLDEKVRAKVQVLFYQKKVVVVAEGDARSFAVPAKLAAKYLKQLSRPVSFLENTGPLFEGVGEALKPKAKGSVDKVKDGSKPETIDTVMSGLTAVDGGMSLVRQIFNAERGPMNPVSSILGFLSGSIWLLGAMMEARGGVKGFEHSKEIGDFEGLRRSQAQMFSGGVGFIGSGLFIGTKAAASTGVGASTVAGLSSATSAAFGLVSLFGAGMASLGMYRCYRFRQRLNEEMESADSKGTGLRAALLFLKKALSISPLEKDVIQTQVDVENPGMSQAEKDTIVEQKLLDLAEKKVKYLKRRIGFKAVEEILEQVDGLLEEFGKGVVSKETMEGSRKLVALVKSENKKKIVLFAWVFLASLLSFVASILFLAAVVSIAPYILMALSTAIFLVIILQGFYVKYLKKDEDCARAEDVDVFYGQGSAK